MRLRLQPQGGSFMLKWCLWVVSVTLLSHCSAPGRSYTDSPNLNETLAVEVLPNGSKMFVYRLQMPEHQLREGVQIERGGHGMGPDLGGGRGGIPISSSTGERIRENAAYVVKQMGYCRDGYMEIDYRFSPGDSWVKGECKEDASAEDRAKYPAKQVLPVVLPH